MPAVTCRFPGGRVRCLRSVNAALAGLLALPVLHACGGNPQPPAAGDSRGGIPDLRGAAVMVLPVQAVRGVGGSPDAELRFQLEQRGPTVRWIFPDELEDAVRRSPGMEMRLTGLPVGSFMVAEVRRVGDPLYGNLRRLAAVTDGEVALVPVQLRHRGSDGAGEGAVELAVTLIDVRSGRVYWFGIVEGDPGAADDPAALASAVDALAARILPFGAG